MLLECGVLSAVAFKYSSQRAMDVPNYKRPSNCNLWPFTIQPYNAVWKPDISSCKQCSLGFRALDQHDPGQDNKYLEGQPAHPLPQKGTEAAGSTAPHGMTGTRDPSAQLWLTKLPLAAATGMSRPLTCSPAHVELFQPLDLPSRSRLANKLCRILHGEYHAAQTPATKDYSLFPWRNEEHELRR